MSYDENSYSEKLELPSPLIEPNEFEMEEEEFLIDDEHNCHCHEESEEDFLPEYENEDFYIEDENTEAYEIEDYPEDFYEDEHESDDISEYNVDPWSELENEDEPGEDDFYLEDWEDYDESEIEDEDYNNIIDLGEGDGYAELEEAFITSLDSLKKLWNKAKDSLNISDSITEKSLEGHRLKLPIVSTVLPDSNNYKKYKGSHRRYFGLPETINALKWIGKTWASKYPNIIFGIGDISQMGGGKISGHGSHRMGIDADVKLITNGKVISSNAPNYAEYRNFVREFINLVKQNPYIPIDTIGFQDSRLVQEFKGLVKPWKNHSEHLHLRFCIPANRLNKQDISIVYGNDKIGSYKLCGNSSSIHNSTNIATPKRSNINIDVNDAIIYNNRKKGILGWDKFKEVLNTKLGLKFSDSSDSEFALAVARWQKNNGFDLNDVDGKIGPNTWRKMKAVFGLKSENLNKTSTITAAHQVIKRSGGWGGWKGKSSQSTTRISPELISDKYDLAIVVASSVEGTFDKVNMYDRGIISWGIKQWTIHAGSLQKLLAFIRKRLRERGLSNLWDQLFPGLNVIGEVLIYENVKYPTSNKLALMRLFRGTESKSRYDENIVDKWINLFALAGRNPVIQSLQIEYAKGELKKLLDSDLGKILSRLRKCKSSKGWCKTIKSFKNFNPDNYGRIGQYLESRSKSMALFNGMYTQNPVWTYIYLKRAIDIMISNYNSANHSSWPNNWQIEMENTLVSLFEASGVACWGTQAINNKSGCKGRTSRTMKLLKAFNRFK